MRVLIAEDDEVVREVLATVVEDDGHEPLVAADGEAAWALFRDEGADVVLTDWRMPGCPGVELCRRIRAHAGRPYAYVVLVTALGDRDHMLQGREAGADDFLGKPFDLGDIEARLRVAERVLVLLREREGLLRLEAVLLAARTAQHHLNNQLALTVGYAELLAIDPRLPVVLRPRAEESARGARAAAETVARLQRITSLDEEDQGGPGPILDLRRVTGSPADA